MGGQKLAKADGEERNKDTVPRAVKDRLQQWALELPLDGASASKRPADDEPVAGAASSKRARGH